MSNAITGLITLLLVLLFIILCIIKVWIRLRENRTCKIISKRTVNLGRDVITETRVLEYINFVKSIKKMPNQPVAWNTLRAAYGIINGEKSISQESKKQLRIVLQSRGVSGIK